LQLTAGPYVGLIPINPTLTIDVRPKLPVGNLARILQISQQQIQVIERLDRLYESVEQQTASLLELMVRNLLRALTAVQTHGFDKSYEVQHQNNSHPRGRISIPRTVRINFSRGSSHKLIADRHELTIDTKYNRLIKAALLIAAQRLIRLENRDRVLLGRLNGALQDFAQVSLVDPLTIARNVENDLRANKISSMRHYYIRPLAIALAIVRGGGVNIGTGEDGFEMSSYIVNFETLFENYLREVLKRELKDNASIRIVDGNSEGRRSLFDDSEQPPAQPDIVVLGADGEVASVLDVKYKETVDRADINQAIAYGFCYRAPHTILVHQTGSDQTAGLRKLGRVGPLSVLTFGFDLTREPLEDEEREFSNQIAKLACLLTSGPICWEQAGTR
jgi:5-methylcytosine-specific restriction enzyme subunit McrC